jgi:hypothetical protein
MFTKTAKKLTQRGRSHVAEKNFVFPENRKYPIHDKTHAQAALRFVGMHGTPSEKSKVKQAVKSKYPDIKISNDN